MVDDPVGCLTGEPLPDGFDWLWEWEQMQRMEQYEESLFNPF